MARIRTIKPEFWLNEELASVSAEACLMAIGLLNISDDEGFFNANEKLIVAGIFPLRELSVSAHELLNELSNIGYLELFFAEDGKRYGHIKKFKSHQVISRPTVSKIKGLCRLNEDSLNTHGAINDDSIGKGKERKGKESNADAQSDKPINKSKLTISKKPDDVSVEVWEGWIAHRKAKKAQVTDLVMTQHREESDQVGISLNDALIFTISKGWVAFNANYYRKAVGFSEPARHIDSMMTGAV